MSTAISLALLLVFLVGGYAAARLGLSRFSSWTARAFSVALYLLLFSMGLRIGQSREVLSGLPLVGFLALSGALLACAGTVVLHLAFAPLYRALDRAALPGHPRDTGPHSSEVRGSRAAEISGGNPSLRGSRRLSMLFFNLKKPLILLVLVILGSIAGFFLPEVAWIGDGSVATWILYFLLFIIGMQMADGDGDLVGLLARPSILLVPAVTIAGTFLGSLGTLAFGGMTVARALALGSGFGWYSLSGILIANAGDPLLGTAAFLSNLFRETISFLVIPLLHASGRPESAIGIAGATSMDVTLPVIEDSWGTAAVPLAVAHGVILSLLVPFLVPVFMSL